MADCSDGPSRSRLRRTGPPGGARRRIHPGGLQRPRQHPTVRRLPRALGSLAALALTGLVTVAAAGPATAAGPGGGGSWRPAPSVEGVKIGWLPSGVSLTGVVPTTRIGRNVIIGTFEGDGTRVQLTVQRETPDATLADVASAYTQYYPGSQIGRIALRGTEGVTLRTSGAGINELTWVEGDPSVVLTVGGRLGGNATTPPSPLPEADLLRIATSLTVGPAPTPTVWQKLSKPMSLSR